MNQPPSVIRSISDTARWVAYFRAVETQRADALFRDPYAERFAGERGFDIAQMLLDTGKQEWAWAARTYLFDDFLLRQLRQGADLVLALAAGFDARPYRLPLPEMLTWVEIDRLDILSYKETTLAAEKANCRLERICLDLLDEGARRAFFAKLNGGFKKIVVIAEGLLLYLSPEEVASIATDLAAGSHFDSWMIDLVSPGQLAVMQKRDTGKHLSLAGIALKFGPAEGPNFFLPYGWEPREVRGLLKTAAGLNRAPSELLAYLPEPEGAPGKFPWSGVCLLKRRETQKAE